MVQQGGCSSVLTRPSLTITLWRLVPLHVPGRWVMKRIDALTIVGLAIVTVAFSQPNAVAQVPWLKLGMVVVGVGGVGVAGWLEKAYAAPAVQPSHLPVGTALPNTASAPNPFLSSQPAASRPALPSLTAPAPAPPVQEPSWRMGTIYRSQTGEYCISYVPRYCTPCALTGNMCVPNNQKPTLYSQYFQ